MRRYRVAIPDYQKTLFALLMRARPCQLASAVKTVLRIHRRIVQLEIEGPVVFWIDPVSVFGQDIINRSTYEPHMTQLVTILGKPGMVFMDVGASEGYFSVLAARCGARVYAIEPQTRMQLILRENFRLNHLSNHQVEVCQVLLSDCKGEKRIHLRPMTNPGASSIHKVGKLGLRTELLPTSTVDEIVREKGISRIGLMKVDCEGSEHGVIRGAAATLRQKRVDFIALEYHPNTGLFALEECEKTHRLLGDWGYTLSKVNGLTIYHSAASAHDLERLGPVRTGCHWQDR